MHLTRCFIPVVAALAGAAVAAGCAESLECGPGTIEEDGVCAAADGTSPEADSCGDGTHYDDELLTCVPDLPPTICGPNTAPSVNEEGVIVCEGTGGSGCGSPIQCPSPTPPRVAVCGQLYDIETGQPLEAEGATGEACDPANPTADGPCSLEIAFFNPLSFAGNPTGTAPQAVDAIVLDDCGRFRGENVLLDNNGFMAVAADDAGFTPPNPADADAWILTGIAFAMVFGEKLEDVRAYATSHATDEAWTESAGNPFGAGVTFADRGVYVPTFTYQGEPVEGVRITAAGMLKPDDDFYFSDEDPTLKTTVSADLTATGANGSGLLVNSALGMHGGTGGEAEGCMWPSNLATTIAGVVFAQDRPAEIAGMAETECP